MLGAIKNGYKIITLVLKGNDVRNGLGLVNSNNLLNWAISSQALFDMIILNEEGSTTIRKGVVPSGTKCRESLEDCDIVWSDMKVSVG